MGKVQERLKGKKIKMKELDDLTWDSKKRCEEFFDEVNEEIVISEGE